MRTTALVAAFCLVSLSCFAQTENTTALSMEVSPTAGTAMTNGSLKWTYDLQIAEDQARKSDQLVLAYFKTDANAKCKLLEQDVFTNALVLAEMQKFVPTKIDFLPNTKLAYSLWLYGAGTFAILDSDGVVLARADVDEAIDSSDELLAFMKKGEEAKAQHKVAIDSAAVEDKTSAPAQLTTESVPMVPNAAMPAAPVIAPAETLTTGTPETSAPVAN